MSKVADVSPDGPMEAAFSIHEPEHSPESASELESVPSWHSMKSDPRVVAEVLPASWSTKPPTSTHLTPILLRFVLEKTALIISQDGIPTSVWTSPIFLMTSWSTSTTSKSF